MTRVNYVYMEKIPVLHNRITVLCSSHKNTNVDGVIRIMLVIKVNVSVFMVKLYIYLCVNPKMYSKEFMVPELN